MYSSRSTEDIHQIVVKFADEGRDCVLAVVLDADGSTPCRVGSKAVIDAEGVIQGTIGGGWVEAETQRRAAETLKAGRPVVLEFNLDSPAVGDDHPICGGTVRVLMDPTAVRHREVYATAFAIRRDRQRGVLLTTIRGRNEWDVAVEFLDKQAISPGLGFPGTEAISAALEREEPSLFVSESTPDGQRLEVLVEPVIPRPVLLIVGGGHVGQAVATHASLVGFDIVVIDDRPGYRICDGARNRNQHRGTVGRGASQRHFATDSHKVGRP